MSFNTSHNQTNYLNPYPSPLLSSNQSPSQSPSFTISQNQSYNGSPQINKAGSPGKNINIQYHGVQQAPHQLQVNQIRSSI